eukprot:scaffold2737_cov156-Amphora_coffeaeformis.AAC.5
MSEDDSTVASTSHKGNDFAASVPEPPFTMGNYHKKALITLLYSFHNNRQSISYSELSRRLEVGEKTKSWQCGAFKDLRDNGYLVGQLKALELHEDKGVALASTLVSAEELAEYQVPDTTEKLHEQIKKRLMKIPKGGKMGVKILDLMLSPEYIPLNRNDMAAKFDTLADSHSFFYGLKALKEWGYVVFCDKAEAADLKNRFPDASSTIMGTIKQEEPVLVKKESNEIDGETKKRKAEEDEEIFNAQEETETKTPPPKKKLYKSKKKRKGGMPLKLSETVFIKLA